MTQRLSDITGHAYGSANFPTSLADIPAYLANLDPMTTGLILLATCTAYIVWSGSADERASRARQRSGRAVTLPPPIVPHEFTAKARGKRS